MKQTVVHPLFWLGATLFLCFFIVIDFVPFLRTNLSAIYTWSTAQKVMIFGLLSLFILTMGIWLAWTRAWGGPDVSLLEMLFRFGAVIILCTARLLGEYLVRKQVYVHHLDVVWLSPLLANAGPATSFALGGILGAVAHALGAYGIISWMYKMRQVGTLQDGKFVPNNQPPYVARV